MDFMCRGGEKYFALMLYFLYFTEQEETLKGNVNSIYGCWVYYEGWLLLGFPGF